MPCPLSPVCRRLVRVIAWIAALLVLLSVVASADAETVCSVYDGDTLRLCSGRTVRLLGVDAPEVKPPPGTRARRSLDKRQPYATTARDELRRLVLHRPVGLACDGTQTHKRQVCRVLVQGVDVGERLIWLGLAYHERRYTSGDLTRRYRAAQWVALQGKRGVWRLPQGGERPWNYRRRLRAR